MLSKSFLLVAALVAVCGAQSKAPVYVYYESLCPDSAKFINEQLYPVAKALKNNIDLHLIPFGKSTYTTQGADVLFECHHGPNECYGNKVHACAIENIQGNSYQQNRTKEALVLEYVNCLMARAQLKEGAFPGKICADQFEINNWNVISDCANSTEGSRLLLKYGEDTNMLQSPLSSVPTVAFKQSFDSDFQRLSLANFRRAVCSKLNPSPIDCRDLPGSATAVRSFGLAAIVALLMATFF